MKSYTDLSQSNVLAEIMPIGSADMWYHGHYSPWESESKYDNEPCPFHSMSPNWDKPCWSLAALLSVVSEEVSLNSFKDGNWNAMVQQNGKMIYSDANNPVDACVAMIEKLHEQNLL